MEEIKLGLNGNRMTELEKVNSKWHIVARDYETGKLIEDLGEVKRKE